MEIKRYHKIGMGISLVIVIFSLFFMKSNFFFLIIGIGVLFGVSPFITSLIRESRSESEKEEMFLEFARNLVESVKVGTPISKSIINIRDKAYGSLGQHIEKLANQIQLGIPLHTALEVFSKDVRNKTISRSLTLIGEAERAGGNIGQILEEVTSAVRTSDKLRKERKSSISTLVVQGYIIFVIFLIIILVMQFKILPMISGVTNLGQIGLEGLSNVGVSSESNVQDISSAFLYLLLTQGLFSGLAIGKLSEGNIKAGIKHSFALMTLSFLVYAGANLFL